MRTTNSAPFTKHSTTASDSLSTRREATARSIETPSDHALLIERLARFAMGAAFSGHTARAPSATNKRTSQRGLEFGVVDSDVLADLRYGR